MMPMHSAINFVVLYFGFLIVLLGSIATQAATIEISAATALGSDEEFEDKANKLQPGDQLVLHGGTYSQTGRRAITVKGSREKPIIIRAFGDGTPLLTRPAGDYTHNNVEIIDSAYLVIKGLHFQGGSSGVRFIGGHHITFEDNTISATGNNALSMNSANSDAFIIRRNHIHHTGLDRSNPTEGEGMYVGCNDHQCEVSNSLIEGNYIHDLRGSSRGGNDGIEVKVGSYNNMIRHNVIHNTDIGTRYPCIFVYGGGRAINIVESNILWNCGEAIQVVSDAVIRNNIIFNSDTGITAAPHSQVPLIKNVTIVNNTIAGHGQCLYLRWKNSTDMVLANNAIYCPGTSAINAADLIGVTINANFVEGDLLGVKLDGSRFLSGGSAASAFVNMSAKNYWPTVNSVLRGKTNAGFVPVLDFNGTRRSAPSDVGAYQTQGLTVNPGWQVVEGFKKYTTK